MNNEINVGDIFTWLKVVDIERGARGGKTFVCECKCGSIVKLEKYQLDRDYTSCGCKKRKHGMAGTRIYEVWVNMKKRCQNKHATFYNDYGGRGIKVCDKWETFEGFYDDMNDGYKDNLTIDRIDVNGNYTKENCRWVSMKVQMNNMRSNNYVEYQGEILSLSDFAEKHNLDYHLFRSRILRGFSVEKAMEPKWIDEITYNGESIRIKDLAEQHGMTYAQLKKRLTWGWDIERALTQAIRKKK